MNVYRVTDGLDALTFFAGTKGEAHDWAKALPKHHWPEVKIDLLDMQADKAGVVHALNRSPVFTEVESWGLTKRGGLEAWKE